MQTTENSAQILENESGQAIKNSSDNQSNKTEATKMPYKVDYCPRNQLKLCILSF